MSDIISKGRSAWFSLSVPKSKVSIWVNGKGHVESNPFEADLVFAENGWAGDVQKIFQSKEFLTGHLTVFHSDLIECASKQGGALNVMEYIILPEKEFDELGTGLKKCVKNNPTVRKPLAQPSKRFKTCASTTRNIGCQTMSKEDARLQSYEAPAKNRTREKATVHQSVVGNCEFDDALVSMGFKHLSSTSDKISVSTTKNTGHRATSKKDVTERGHAVRSNHRTGDKATVQHSAVGGRDFDRCFLSSKRLKPISTTNDRVCGTSTITKNTGHHSISKRDGQQQMFSVHPYIRTSEKGTVRQSLNGGSNLNGSLKLYSSSADTTSVGKPTPKTKVDGASRNPGTFYNSLVNFDIAHLDDLPIPLVTMMDFEPGVDGCRVEKRKTNLCLKHTS